MLNAIHPDVQLLQYEEHLELFLKYCTRRIEDLAKEPTYVPGGKPKTPRVKKGKMITTSKLSKLDAGTIALLRKAGIEI